MQGGEGKREGAEAYWIGFWKVRIKACCCAVSLGKKLDFQIASLSAQENMWVMKPNKMLRCKYTIDSIWRNVSTDIFFRGYNLFWEMNSFPWASMPCNNLQQLSLELSLGPISFHKPFNLRVWLNDWMNAFFFFFLRCDDDCVGVKEKMKYAATNSELKKQCNGFETFEFHDKDDFCFQKISNELKAKDRQ